MTFSNLSKKCPFCGLSNKPYESQVMTDGYLVHRYTCARCHIFYFRLDEPRPTVEPLVGFTRSMEGK